MGQWVFSDHFNPSDVVLTDREFDMADSVGLWNAELKIPAFRKKATGSSRIEIDTRTYLSMDWGLRVIGDSRNRYTILKNTIGIHMCENEHLKGLRPRHKIGCTLTNLAPSKHNVFFK